MPVSPRRAGDRPPPQPPAITGLRPYQFHGLELSARPGATHGVGQCPFCNRSGKISICVDTGLWRCLVCATGTDAGGGNPLVFLRLLHALAWGQGRSPGPGPSLDTIAADRGLSAATLAAWGVCLSPLDGSWLVPGYGEDGALDQLYRRSRIRDGDEWVWRLLPTPGVWPVGQVHALHMASADFDPECPDVYICEGPWDGMAFWDAARGSSIEPCQVIAVPGCNAWQDRWSELCRGKNVTLLFDSDHPRVQGLRTFRAGYDGMARVARKLSGIAASVRWLRWGPDGYDPDKPSGWDVRDHLAAVGPSERRAALEVLLNRVEDAPDEWFSSGVVTGGRVRGASTRSQPCQTWAECEAAWQSAMRWRTDMSDALAVILAVCASTQQAGNQLFLQLVGSAGSGKTTMCDGILTSRHCHHLEHLTGFHSGFKKKGSDKDCSLIARINGKTLVTPEADVLMSSPRFEEIMSQQRRIFDGKSGATYKNSDEDTLHEGLRTPWIMAGTPAMMDHDQSHLGDRFLRFIIEDPDQDEKRAILQSAIRSERIAMLDSSNGTAGSILDPRTRLAHGLTGGYVDWLRASIEEELSKVDIDEYAEDWCIDLAELSADLRARPNPDKRKLEVHDTKELPTRLARQNIRMASCLAVVLNKRSIDADVLRIVRKISLDTAHGHSLKIVGYMCSPNPKADDRLYQECGGLTEGSLSVWTSMTAERLTTYLNFLRKIDVLDLKKVSRTANSWVLTERMYDLYLRVMREL